jgi:hypothetical protein
VGRVSFLAPWFLTTMTAGASASSSTKL